MDVALTLALDHGQFAVLDRDAAIDPDAYTTEAHATGLVQFDGGIVALTESQWSEETPLRVRLVEERPEIDLGAHEHVVLGGLDCTTGELRIFSPEETGVNERTLTLPPGKYGVVVCGDGFGETDEYGDNGADHYELWCWRTDNLPNPQSFKDGRQAG